MSDPMWENPTEPRTRAGRWLIAAFPGNAADASSPAFIRHMAQSILAIEAEAAALDVDRLARAIMSYPRPADSGPASLHDVARREAVALATEYALLAGDKAEAPLVSVRENTGGVFPDGTTNHPPIDFTAPVEDAAPRAATEPHTCANHDESLDEAYRKGFRDGRAGDKAHTEKVSDADYDVFVPQDTFEAGNKAEADWELYRRRMTEAPPKLSVEIPDSDNYWDPQQ